MSVAAARGRVAIGLWLAFVVACGVIISHSRFTADLSAFLPRSPTAAQQLLLEQLRDGLASRLILAGIEGADAPARAKLSRLVAQRLRGDPAFVSVNNGEPVSLERDRAFLFDHRYLLSPAVTPSRFSAEGLHAAIGESIDLIASPAGMLTRSLLARDPTGEMVQLLEQLSGGNRPRTLDGVWASRDGARALMLVRTRALGSDIDAQERAMTAIQQAFDDARGATPGATAARLVMTGPGVFSVTSRETIRSEVNKLSIAGFLIIASLLLLIYRSATALALGVLPVLSGVLAGIAAVSLGFGVVHGITMGFGTALIGEAVDYSIYLFVQSEQSGARTNDWVKAFWPTVRLGVLTSIFGFASLLLSGFPGLAQLGAYAMAGLVTAALVTRFVLPHLLPASFRIHDVTPIGVTLARWTAHAGKLRWIAALVLLAACGVLAARHANLWNHSLGSLSPVSQSEAELDASLRMDTGAPDARYLVVVSGADREAALQAAEKVTVLLQPLVENGVLAGFETPTRFLPSAATQRARQASLPDTNELQARLTQAVQGLPIGAQRLAPFVADVAKARAQPLLQARDLENTAMAMAVDALLVARGAQWSVLMPLTAPAQAEIDADKVRAALTHAGDAQALFIDFKGESYHLYSGYLREAIALSLIGLAAIVGLLLVTLRSVARTVRVVAPLAAAVITVSAGLAVFGQQLTLLHLVGLLLVVAVGSNYALFFDRPANSEATTAIAPRTLASMLLANLTTVAGFGLLAFSKVSILQSMGVTVAPGVVLALIYAAIFARQAHD